MRLKSQLQAFYKTVVAAGAKGDRVYIDRCCIGLRVRLQVLP